MQAKPIYVLDTDLLSLLERGGRHSLGLTSKLDKVLPSQIVSTIVSYDEQMRGWLSFAARAITPDQMVVAYSRLQTHILTLAAIPLLPFDQSAATEFARISSMRTGVGTSDRKIAAISLANKATLLTRNLRDFAKIPELSVEDWS